MATAAPGDEKVVENNHDLPNNMDEKVDPEVLRNDKNLGVDGIPDPDAGLSEELRAENVRSIPKNEQFRYLTTIYQDRKLLRRLDLKLIPWVSLPVRPLHFV